MATLRNLALAALLVGGAAPAMAQPSEPHVCSTLRTLTSAVTRDGGPRIVEVTTSRAPDALIWCGPTADRRVRAVCHAVLGASGMEHGFMLPQWVADCLEAQGVPPSVHRLAPQSWVPAFDRVDADLPRRLHLALRYTPDDDKAPFFGTYRLEVRPRSPATPRP